MLFIVFGPSLLIQGVLHGVGRGRHHFIFHQVAYHFKVMFGCFGHLRDKCLKLGQLVRNLLAFHQPLRIWESLACRIKIQHQSHPMDPAEPPSWQLSAAYITSACSQNPGWFPDLASHTTAKNPPLPKLPRALRVYYWSRPPPTSADSAGFSCLRVEWTSVTASQNQRKNSRDLFVSQNYCLIV